MTHYEFFYKVDAMRQAQRDYFCNRTAPDSRRLLQKSRGLEAEIDREIKRVRQVLADRQQGKLFEWEEAGKEG